MKLLWDILTLSILTISTCIDTVEAQVVKTLLQHIDNVDVKTQRTAGIVKTWKASPSETRRIVDDFNALGHEWNVGIYEIRKTPSKMNESDTDKIKTPMQKLDAKLEALSSTIVSRKRDMDSIHFTQQMLDSCQFLRGVVDNFGKAVIKRVHEKKVSQYKNMQNSMVKRVDQAISGLRGSPVQSGGPNSAPQPNQPYQPYGYGPSDPFQNQPQPSQQNPRPAGPSDRDPFLEDGWDWSPSPSRETHETFTFTTTIYGNPTGGPYS